MAVTFTTLLPRCRPEVHLTTNRPARTSEALKEVAGLAAKSMALGYDGPPSLKLRIAANSRKEITETQAWCAPSCASCYHQAAATLNGRDATLVFFSGRRSDLSVAASVARNRSQVLVCQDKALLRAETIENINGTEFKFIGALDSPDVNEERIVPLRH